MGDVPCSVPVHEVLVDEQAHQFSDGDGWVRVVQLDGEGAMQIGELAAERFFES